MTHEKIIFCVCKFTNEFGQQLKTNIQNEECFPHPFTLFDYPDTHQIYPTLNKKIVQISLYILLSCDFNPTLWQANGSSGSLQNAFFSSYFYYSSITFHIHFTSLLFYPLISVNYKNLSLYFLSLFYSHMSENNKKKQTKKQFEWELCVELKTSQICLHFSQFSPFAK